MKRRQPKSTLIPYTTLFRSAQLLEQGECLPAVGERLLVVVELGVIPADVVEGVGLSDLVVDGSEQGVSQLGRSEEHTSELQSRQYLVCRLLLEKKQVRLSTA